MTKHIDSKIEKCKKHLFALKSVIGKKWGPNPHLMRWAYIGIVRPKLTYACHLWYHKMTETTKKKLLKLNRLACLSIAPVHKSTPTLGMEIIYDILPLDLYVEQVATKIHSRIQNQIHPCWSGIGKNPKDLGHIYIGKKIISSMGLQNLPSEQIKKRNWTRKFEILNFLDHKNDASENANTYYCYTDGSKMKSQAGFGYQIRVKHKERNKNSTYLGSIATVFQAEVMAISMVAKDLQRVQGQRIIIRSDSQAAVLALQSSYIDSSIVEECLSALNRLSEKNKVILQWIKAHVGHAGNEAADLYAKLGSETKVSGPEPFLPVPQSFIDTKISDKIKQKWTKRWSKEKSCRQTKLWFETISTKFKAFLAKGSRIEVGRLVQFITGHCNLRRHQNLINNEVCKSKL